MTRLFSEPLVFVGTAPQKLRYAPASADGIVLTGPPSPEGASAAYRAGVDYVVDAEARTVRRTEGSRIPDWREHPHFGLDKFDHAKVPYRSNGDFTCTIRYNVGEVGAAAPVPPMRETLPKLYRKLAAGETVTYVVYGDSISAGYEASAPELSYPERFAASLRSRFPGAEVVVRNRAVPGEGSFGGVKRIDDVVALRPDLVTIAYGMNDQNRNPDGSNATPVEAFERNVAAMATAVRERSNADVLLVTPCLPNPRWAYASDNATAFAEAIRRVGAALGVPVADAQRIWLAELAAGKSHESLLLNNLNHPNDYGHGLYAEALEPYAGSNE
ncbi:SGNH/GDSL hydrolase family protein [Paenibacillus antri]|uniref:SGNH/GDSL hydrolase family protein n=1 Tax=Paenibacillus antri TaxID=2582848 RepID=A0A5R9G928_9BACL|nr:SGNH/GDSL hydrolase family protein [Paenibacillus antri]TLS50876.1 SGNH/GDSL hydrolase family protein [Paenibacillus antri]